MYTISIIVGNGIYECDVVIYGDSFLKENQNHYSHKWEKKFC